MAHRTRFGKLLSISDLDAFLATGAAQVPRVAMADSGRNGSAAVPEEEFTFGDGKVDPSKVFPLFDAGATLVVSQFHELHPPLADFCRGLEKVFQHGVQANIYLTPPGAQGFRTHFDTHDVLVLQVSGRKDWRVWSDCIMPHATRRTPWDGALYKPDVTQARDVVLEAGDVLYVPRGVLHDASVQAGGEPSLHITVGFLDQTWADALKSAIDQLEQTEPKLREAFPMWRLGDDTARPALIAAAAERAAIIGSQAGVELAAMQFLQALAQERMPMSGRTLVAPAPGPNDRLIIADAVHHHVVPVGEGAELRWSGDPVPLTMAELGWLEKLSGGASPASLGGGDAALGFCRHLFKVGFLVKA
jgi:ribosomal protein L16 Arg81 hydroxylase